MKSHIPVGKIYYSHAEDREYYDKLKTQTKVYAAVAAVLTVIVFAAYVWAMVLVTQ